MIEELGQFKDRVGKTLKRELSFVGKLARRDPNPLSLKERQNIEVRQAIADYARTPEGQRLSTEEIERLMGIK